MRTLIYVSYDTLFGVSYYLIKKVWSKGQFVHILVADDDWSEYSNSGLVVAGLLESSFTGQEYMLQITGQDRSHISFSE
jgi:hypothetical protein